MSRLIDIASAEIGTKEVAGSTHNERILSYAHEAGFDWVNSDETPWCSLFLNWVAHKAGYERTKDGRARSWRHIGTPVTEPKPGDVMLIGTHGSLDAIYHVGLFTGFTKNGQQAFCLGGNQSDTVSIARYWRKNIAGYRRLEATEVPLNDTKEPAGTPPREEPVASTPPPTSPEPPRPVPEQKDPSPKETPDEEEAVANLLEAIISLLTAKRLTYGDRGERVRQLQANLNRLGFDAGVVDGIFGRKTEAALKEFQRDTGIRANGKFNGRTRRRLRRRLRRKRRRA